MRLLALAIPLLVLTDGVFSVQPLIAEPQKSTNWALIVGAERYSSLGDLSYCREDAEALYSMLTDATNGLFRKDHVILLTDDVESSHEKYPSKANIVKWLEWLSSQASGGELVLFYFSGHGSALEEQNYIYPPEFKPSDDVRKAVSTRKIFEELDKTHARQRIVILDACRAESRSASSGFIDETEARGRFEIYAAREGSVAYEAPDYRHGVMTAGILEALAGKADTDGNARVTLGEIKLFTERFVIRWAREHQKPQSMRFGGEWGGEWGDVTIGLSSRVLLSNLTIRTQPLGFAIYLNGKRMKGKTPRTVTNIKGREVILELRRDGFKRFTSRIELTPGVTVDTGVISVDPIEAVTVTAPGRGPTTTNLLRVFEGHTDKVWGVEFSPDGRHILSAGFDRTTRLWDASTATLLRTDLHDVANPELFPKNAVPLLKNVSGVYDVAFSPDGQRAASGAGDGNLWVWDVESGRLIKSLRDDSMVGSDVLSVAFSPDGEFIAAGHGKAIFLGGDGLNQEAVLWNVETARIVRRLKHDANIYDVEFSSDGKYLLSGGGRTVRLWAVSTGRLIRKFETKAKRTEKGDEYYPMYYSMALGNDGRYLLTGTWDGDVNVYEVSTGRLARTFAGREAPISCVSFSPDGQHVLIGFRDRVEVWDVSAGEVVQSFRNSPEGRWAGSVNAAAFSPDGRQVVCGSGYKLRLYEIVLHPLTTHVRVDSDPQGAEIQFGGVSYGETPKLVKGLSGTQAQMRLKLAGFTEHTETVTLKPGFEKTLAIIPLQRQFSISGRYRSTDGIGSSTYDIEERHEIVTLSGTHLYHSEEWGDVREETKCACRRKDKVMEFACKCERRWFSDSSSGRLHGGAFNILRIVDSDRLELVNSTLSHTVVLRRAD